MARALTAGELENLRKDGQRSILYLAVHIPATVYTARVNGIPSSDDKVFEIDYDGGAGTPAEALAGMTVYVGGVAGACDVGKVRLRETLIAASGTMKIGETSEIQWTDDDYLTVVDEFALWPRHLRIDDAGVVYMDYDIVYSDQHEDLDPIPVLGPDAVTWLTGATVDVDFDGSDSWVLGSSITTYAWLAPGASATSGLATATPTITYDTASTTPYRVQCTVTAANGKSFVGYRYVFVYDDDNMPATVLRLNNCSVDWRGGGASFNITMWDEATQVELLERARVILFARDWYGATETSIGPVADRENIIAIGRIENESIDWRPDQGNVSFNVKTANFWLGKMQGFPSGIEDFDGTPTVWTQFEDLTLDKGLWHFLHWRTTASQSMDWTLTGDDRQISVFDAPPASLWQQITREAERAILAHPCCDRYGRLFIQIDSQFLPVADRASIPTVQTLLKNDWREGISIARVTISPNSMLDVSGVAYADDDATALFALSPGRVFKRFGIVDRLPRLALTDQAQVNLLAGLVAGNKNNPYPNIDVLLAANNRAFDVCPHQYGVISIDASDTERGITLTDQKIIARRVSFSHRPNRGILLADVDFEAYTTAATGIPGDPPPEPPSVPITAPPLPPIPPEPTPDVDIGTFILDEDQVAVTFDITAVPPVWYDGDPNNDLVGAFQSIAVTSDGQAYITTRTDGNPGEDNTGLWHCDDISLAVGGTISWTLIKSASAAADTAGIGYIKYDINDACCFGSVFVNATNQVCALIHSIGNRMQTSGCYIGSGATVNISLFGTITGAGGNPFFQEQPANSTLHSVWGGTGDWYIAGKTFESPNNKGYLAVEGWTFVDFWTGPAESHLVGASGASGYVVGQSKAVYVGWVAVAFGTLTIQAAMCIFENFDSTHYLYLEDDGNFDLYEDGAGPIGDASVDFGVAMSGSMAAYFPGSDEIVWLRGTAGAIATFPVLIHSDDGGVSWSDKSGNLAAVIGATWTGWTSAALANAIVRTFEF